MLNIGKIKQKRNIQQLYMTEMDNNIIKNKNCFFTIKIFVGFIFYLEDINH